MGVFSCWLGASWVVASRRGLVLSCRIYFLDRMVRRLVLKCIVDLLLRWFRILELQGGIGSYIATADYVSLIEVYIYGGVFHWGLESSFVSSLLRVYYFLIAFDPLYSSSHGFPPRFRVLGIFRHWSTGRSFRILCNSLWCSCVSFSLFSLIKRAKVEDELMMETFGKDWHAYSAKVPYRFIPFVYWKNYVIGNFVPFLMKLRKSNNYCI